MPWSGSSPNQTFGRTDGTRTGATTWQEADGAGVDIIAVDHDTHDQDLAAGINAALKKDGGNSPSANLPMGGYKHTNVGVATALTQYLSATQAFQSVGRHVTTVGGTANAVTLTTGFSLAAYTEGMTFTWKVTSAITGPLTVNVDGLGAKSVLTLDGSELQTGEIRADFIPIICYDGTRFRWLNKPTSGSSGDVLARITPVGIVAPWPGATAPSGWLFAYGQAVSRTGYAELFAAYGTTYGTGDGSTTFNLPDYRGRAPFGDDNMGGSTAGRITAAGSGITGTTLGAVGGAETHALTAAQMPVHNHSASASVTDPGHVHSQTVTTGGATGPATGGGFTAYAFDGSQDTGAATTGISVSVSIGNAGSGGAHNNMPPAIIQNWIILALPAEASAANTGVCGYLYRWSESTSGDPGSGKIGFDNETLASAIAFRISETDAAGSPLAPVLATWDNSTSTVKGTLHVFKVGELSTFVHVTISGTLTDNGGYDSFTSAFVASNGTFSEGDQVGVLYVPTSTGDVGPSGSDGGFKFTFDSSTTMGAPAAGALRLNNATLGSVTEIAIANTSADAGNPAVDDWIATWDDSTTTAHRGVLYIRKASASNNQIILDVTSSVTDNSTWLTCTVAVISSAGTLTNADDLLVSFSRTGDKGLDGAGSGTVTSITAGAGLSSSGVGATGGALTVSGTLTAVEAVNAQTGTSYTVLSTDHTKLLSLSNTSSVAVTVPQATSSFGAGFWFDVANLNSGVVTLTPTTSTINGAASFVLNRFQSVRVISDGTNWQVMQGTSLRGQSVTVASATTCDIGAIASHRVAISGTTTITGFGTVPNQIRFGSFSGILTLTHHATSLILPGGANITTAAGDTFIAWSDASGNWTVIYQKASGAAVVGSSGSGSPSIPQGRLTLTSETPVLTSTVTGAATIYYALYSGRYVPLYNGSAWTMTDIAAELSQATTDSTKSPAGCANNSNYDLFVWDDGGTYRCTRGPAWSSDTARGTGAGTTELERVNGIYVNKIAITRGPAAQRGTYVGTIRTNGTSSVDYIFGALAAGGTAGVFGVWNMYNRVNVATMVRDSTDSWTYASTAWRAANNSSTYRVSYVCGLAEDNIAATYQVVGFADVLGNNQASGIGIDSTTAFTGATGFYNQVGASGHFGRYEGIPGLGFHFVSAIEYRAAGTQTFTGDSGVPTYLQCGLSVSLRL